MTTIILTHLCPLFHQAVTIQFQNQPGFELLDAGSAVDHMARLLDQRKPRLAITDLDLINSHGTNPRVDRLCPAFPFLQRIHSICPETRFVILASHIHSILIDHTVELGIGGYLLKNDGFTLHLPDVVRTILDGGTAFSQAVLNAKDPLSETRLEPQLTPRQVEILEAMVSQPNLTYQDQAQRLGISRHTLDTHLRTIFQKLEVFNLTAAILTAVRLGIIPYHLLCSSESLPLYSSEVCTSPAETAFHDTIGLSKSPPGG
jgi:DNA-binding NarL/FixJ family response regulator